MTGEHIKYRIAIPERSSDGFGLRSPINIKKRLQAQHSYSTSIVAGVPNSFRPRPGVFYLILLLYCCNITSTPNWYIYSLTVKEDACDHRGAHHELYELLT